MGLTLSCTDLVRIAGGPSYVHGAYSTAERLVSRLRVEGDTVHGEVFCGRGSRARLQLVPPHENHCTCPEGGACKHVVALGLTWLYERYREAESRSGPVPFEALAFDKVQWLEERELRSLAIELLASSPAGPALVHKFVDRHEVTQMGQYPEEAEEEAEQVRSRLSVLLSDEFITCADSMATADRDVHDLFTAIESNGFPGSDPFRMLGLAGCTVELIAALNQPGSVAHRWREHLPLAVDQVTKLIAKHGGSEQVAVMALRELLGAYATAGPFATQHLRAALLAAAGSPPVRAWVLSEIRLAGLASKGDVRNRLQELAVELDEGVGGSSRAPCRGVPAKVKG